MVLLPFACLRLCGIKSKDGNKSKKTAQNMEVIMNVRVWDTTGGEIDHKVFVGCRIFKHLGAQIFTGACEVLETSRKGSDSLSDDMSVCFLRSVAPYADVARFFLNRTSQERFGNQMCKIWLLSRNLVRAWVGAAR